MFFFLLYFSVRNNTLGSYKVFFLYISSQFNFWLDFENRSANLEQIRKKNWESKSGSIIVIAIRAYKWHSMKNIDD